MDESDSNYVVTHEGLIIVNPRLPPTPATSPASPRTLRREAECPS